MTTADVKVTKMARAGLGLRADWEEEVAGALLGMYFCSCTAAEAAKLLRMTPLDVVREWQEMGLPA
jgi:hypothetical protein